MQGAQAWRSAGWQAGCWAGAGGASTRSAGVRRPGDARARLIESRITMRVIYALFAVVLGIATAAAQVSGSGTIQGTVTDPSGAAITGVSVTATQVETGVQTSRKTTDAGFFVLTPLQPGDYTVTARAAGFQAHIQ